MSRVYLVTDAKSSTTTLVEADSQHQAIGVVVANRYTATPASAKEVLDAISSGATVIKRETKVLAAPTAIAAPQLEAPSPSPVSEVAEPVFDPLSQGDHPADTHAI